jgi:hypothetical protein
MVGAVDEAGSLASFSNYSRRPNMVYLRGTNMCANEICLSGTSQATAMMTSNVVKILSIKDNNK